MAAEQRLLGGENLERSGRAGRASPRCHSKCRSQRRRWSGAADERSRRGRARYPAFQYITNRLICGSGAFPRSGRIVRGHGLWNSTAQPGNRRASRAWSNAGSDSADDFQRRRSASCRRDNRWLHNRSGAGKTRRQPDVWCQRA